jgi:N-acetylmuramoyl-L-alanine amidase
MTTPAGTPIYAKAEVPFRYGSAQVICDEDSCCETMPLDEVAWGCGDRHLPYDNLNKGQQPAARIWFGNNQNQMTLNVEICNNANWEKAVTNAHNWIIDQLQQRKLTINISCSLNPNVAGILFPGEVLLLTHHAVTGKNCPAPLVADPAEWERIVRDISARTQA